MFCFLVTNLLTVISFADLIARQNLTATYARRLHKNRPLQALINRWRFVSLFVSISLQFLRSSYTGLIPRDHQVMVVGNSLRQSNFRFLRLVGAGND